MLTNFEWNIVRRIKQQTALIVTRHIQEPSEKQLRRITYR